MSPDASVLVVGSINTDLVVRCPRLPIRGKTILGEGIMTLPGGKGANPAAAEVTANTKYE